MTNMAGKKNRKRQYNIGEAKAHLPQLVWESLAGAEVIIAKDNKPVAKLVPFTPVQGQRKPGSAKGQVWTAPDFDAPLEAFEDYSR